MRCLLIKFSMLTLAALIAASQGYSDEPGSRFSSIQFEQSAWANQVALGDVNGDGCLDALIGYDEYFSLLVGDGKGGFEERQRFDAENIRTIQVGDFDGDQKLDVAVNGELWRNDGAGTLKKGSQILDSVKFPRFHDLDNDGDLDAIDTSSLTIYWNDGRGQFDSQVLKVAPKPVGQLSFVDMDRDDLPDVVIWGRDDCRVIFNEKRLFTNSIEAKRSSNDKASLSGGHLLWDDYDGDGDQDVAVVRYGWDDAAPPDYIWLQQGKWQFRISQVIRGYEQWASQAAKADFDRDGDVDLFIGQCGGNNKLWFNDGSGEFSDCIELGSGSHAVAVGDIDGDGDVDIFAVGCTPPTVWLNEMVKSTENP